jgi:hypothetical protein
MIMADDENDVEAIRASSWDIKTSAGAIVTCVTLHGDARQATRVFMELVVREDNPCWLDQQVFEDAVELATNERNVRSIAQLCVHVTQLERARRTYPYSGLTTMHHANHNHA